MGHSTVPGRSSSRDHFASLSNPKSKPGSLGENFYNADMTFEQFVARATTVANRENLKGCNSQLGTVKFGMNRQIGVMAEIMADKAKTIHTLLAEREELDRDQQACIGVVNLRISTAEKTLGSIENIISESHDLNLHLESLPHSTNPNFATPETFCQYRDKTRQELADRRQGLRHLFLDIVQKLDAGEDPIPEHLQHVVQREKYAPTGEGNVNPAYDPFRHGHSQPSTLPHGSPNRVNNTHVRTHKTATGVPPNPTLASLAPLISPAKIPVSDEVASEAGLCSVYVAALEQEIQDMGTARSQFPSPEDWPEEGTVRVAKRIADSRLRYRRLEHDEVVRTITDRDRVAKEVAEQELSLRTQTKERLDSFTTEVETLGKDATEVYKGQSFKSKVNMHREGLRQLLINQRTGTPIHSAISSLPSPATSDPASASRSRSSSFSSSADELGSTSSTSGRALKRLSLTAPIKLRRKSVRLEQSGTQPQDVGPAPSTPVTLTASIQEARVNSALPDIDDFGIAGKFDTPKGRSKPPGLDLDCTPKAKKDAVDASTYAGKVAASILHLPSHKQEERQNVEHNDNVEAEVEAGRLEKASHVETLLSLATECTSAPLLASLVPRLSSTPPNTDARHGAAEAQASGDNATSSSGDKSVNAPAAQRNNVHLPTAAETAEVADDVEEPLESPHVPHIRPDNLMDIVSVRHLTPKPPRCLRKPVFDSPPPAPADEHFPDLTTPTLPELLGIEENIESVESDIESAEKNADSEESIETAEQDIETAEQDIETAKQDIATAEQDIETAEQVIETAEQDSDSVDSGEKDIESIDISTATFAGQGFRRSSSRPLEVKILPGSWPFDDEVEVHTPTSEYAPSLDSGDSTTSEEELLDVEDEPQWAADEGVETQALNNSSDTHGDIDCQETIFPTLYNHIRRAYRALGHNWLSNPLFDSGRSTPDSLDLEPEVKPKPEADPQEEDSLSNEAASETSTESDSSEPQLPRTVVVPFLEIPPAYRKPYPEVVVESLPAKPEPAPPVEAESPPELETPTKVVIFWEQRITRATPEPEDNIEPSKDIIESPKDIIEPPKDIVEPPKDIVKSSKDIIESPKDIIEPPKDIVEPPKDIVKSSKDIIESPKDIIEPPKDIVEPPKDIVEPPKDTVELSEVTVKPAGDTTEIPQVTVKSPEDTVQPLETTSETPATTAATRSTFALTPSFGVAPISSVPLRLRLSGFNIKPQPVADDIEPEENITAPIIQQVTGTSLPISEMIPFVAETVWKVEKVLAPALAQPHAEATEAMSIASFQSSSSPFRSHSQKSRGCAKLRKPFVKCRRRRDRRAPQMKTRLRKRSHFVNLQLNRPRRQAKRVKWKKAKFLQVSTPENKPCGLFPKQKSSAAYDPFAPSDGFSQPASLLQVPQPQVAPVRQPGKDVGHENGTVWPFNVWGDRSPSPVEYEDAIMDNDEIHNDPDIPMSDAEQDEQQLYRIMEEAILALPNDPQPSGVFTVDTVMEAPLSFQEDVILKEADLSWPEALPTSMSFSEDTVMSSPTTPTHNQGSGYSSPWPLTSTPIRQPFGPPSVTVSPPSPVLEVQKARNEEQSPLRAACFMPVPSSQPAVITPTIVAPSPKPKAAGWSKADQFIGEELDKIEAESSSPSPPPSSSTRSIQWMTNPTPPPPEVPNLLHPFKSPTWAELNGDDDEQSDHSSEYAYSEYLEEESEDGSEKGSEDGYYNGSDNGSDVSYDDLFVPQIPRSMSSEESRRNRLFLMSLALPDHSDDDEDGEDDHELYDLKDGNASAPPTRPRRKSEPSEESEPDVVDNDEDEETERGTPAKRQRRMGRSSSPDEDLSTRFVFPPTMVHSPVKASSTSPDQRPRPQASNEFRNQLALPNATNALGLATEPTVNRPPMNGPTSPIKSNPPRLMSKASSPDDNGPSSGASTKAPAVLWLPGMKKPTTPSNNGPADETKKAPTVLWLPGMVKPTTPSSNGSAPGATTNAPPNPRQTDMGPRPSAAPATTPSLLSRLGPKVNEPPSNPQPGPRSTIPSKIVRSDEELRALMRKPPPRDALDFLKKPAGSRNALKNRITPAVQSSTPALRQALVNGDKPWEKENGTGGTEGRNGRGTSVAPEDGLGKGKGRDPGERPMGNIRL